MGTGGGGDGLAPRDLGLNWGLLLYAKRCRFTGGTKGMGVMKLAIDGRGNKQPPPSNCTKGDIGMGRGPHPRS